MTLIRTWLDFALQQMAAESYIHRAQSGELGLLQVLKMGNNNLPGDQSGTDVLSGKTRMTTLQAQEFAQRYQILDHHANDATGFSATLMRDTTTGEYTLSFRSTEFRDESLGGDYDRDAVKADGDIAVHGFAFAQLLAMEEYFARLTQGIRSDGMFDAGLQAFFGNPTHQLNVTGYSLGGHLATVFTELHESEVRQTYLFNASGRGSLPGAVPGLAAEEQRIADMLAYFRRVLDNPDDALASIVRGQNYQDAVTAWTSDPTWDPFDQGTATVYADPRYQWARAATLDAFDPIGTSTIEIATGFQGEPQTTGAFAKMTALYGQAVSGDREVVANSGVHRAGQPVFIEGQPLLANALGILPFGGQVDFGNTHAITLLVDSLSLQELFLTLDPQLQQAQTEALIRSSSNAKSDLIAFTTAAHAAEGDSLEKPLEGLRKLFLPSPLTPATLNFDDAPGGFGNLTNRNDFYAAIAAVKTALAGATVTIEPFVELNAQGNAVIRLTPSEVNAAAEENTDRGLAFRYALKALNPFAVIGADYSGLGHASNGALTLFDPATGFGELTDQYLIDRAAFLEEKIELNLLNDAKSSGNVHFKDFAPNGLEITTVVDLRVDQEFLFGSDGDEGIGVLVGNSKDDHLYGGGGNDLLEGGDGRDYLQGDAGVDRLDGGEEADTMAGGTDDDFYIVDNLGDEVIEGFNSGTDRVESSVSFTLGTNVEHLTLTGTADLNGIGNALNNDITGNAGINRLDGQGGTDHLIGGIGNDILAGGTGDNDLLEGGVGFDTYIYNNGDGIDQIEDSDARGKIVFNGGLLQGGISTDGGATYVSLDGTETYVLSSGHLIVNGALTVNADFQSGQFGIQLEDLSSYPTNTGVPTGPFQVVLTGSEGPDFLGPGGLPGPGNAVFGLGGNDLLAGIDQGVDLLDGGAGDDILTSLSGDDYLDGGPGHDYLRQGDGNGVLLGGAGDDVLLASEELFLMPSDRDYVDGGEGADYLWGGKGTDVLLGGDGGDTLRGDNLPDGWPALHPEFGTPVPGSAIFSATGAADFLDGGSGNDLLVGDSGDDILSGGADNDQLFGDDEAGYLVMPGDDVLDGGAGDDLLAAGDGADSLSGGVGLDQLFGDKGTDVLDGGDEADTLHGGDGADELFGGAGDDLLYGEGLNNQFALSTAGGADFLDGGAGNDHLEGGIGDDTLFGGTENDVLFGEEGADSLFGDEGADELRGGAGNDILNGDAGDDRLFGQADNDTLYGDEGTDTLAGNDGSDTLVGGIGNDILEGGKGSDVLVGGAGHDTYNVSLGDGQDTITDTARAGEGNVIQFLSGITPGSLIFIHDQVQQTLTIQVGGGDSIRLLGFDPNTFNYVVDTLAFADGTQVALADQLPLPGGLIEGTDDNNVIRTGSTDDTIFAGAGNDLVTAGAGNDLIVGGTGTDTLQGGAGQDAYVFNAGDGVDGISDVAGEGNRLVFGAGVSASTLTLGRGSNDSLVIQGQVPGDRVQLIGGILSGLSPIGTFEFADGTILSFDQFVARGIELPGTSGPDTVIGTDFVDRITGGTGNDVLFAQGGADQVFGGDGDDVIRGGEGTDVLHGEAGNDSLEGEAGDDVLAGGLGDDQLLGGEGDDTYHFNLGDGIDSISDSINVAEPNRVVFGLGIMSSTTTLTTTFGQVVVRPSTAFEGVTIGANGSDVLGFRAVDLFEFADGTSITYADLVARGFDIDGTEFDDFLFGTNVIDRFRGGLGNDRLEGGEGNDSYVFNLGDGIDTIVDIASAGAGNEVVLGAGIASSDLRLDLAPDQSDSNLSDLLIRVGAGGDAIQLDTFDRNNVFGPRTVESFRFADGSTLTYNQLLARGFDLTGTDGDDQISGTNVADRIVAGEGADVLRSGVGDDTLDGGLGDDQLIGEQGNDTYEFGPGSGQDTIVEFQGSQDTIRMAFGVAPSDVVVTRSNDDLVLSLNSGPDRLTVSLYFLSSPLQIESVQFTDGTVWDQAFLENLTQPAITGTGGPDSLTGTSGNDRLAGLAGDDQLTGLDGNDLLDGGTGADQLAGGAGDDTYIVDDAGDVVTELANEGVDTVQSVVTRTIDANVERLTLTGTGAINGTGNDLDNVLTGNSAANVLSGGAGNDTYVVGAGDTVVELAMEGTDTVQSGVNATLGANVESLTLTGSASLTGTGNALDNVLQADGSVSILAGGDGNDTYVIGPNDDDDILVETATGGIDTVIAAHDYRLPANIENLTVLDPRVPDFETFSLTPYGSSGISVAGYGNDLDNRLIGGRSNNVLDGGLGADTLIGGAGDDTYMVDHPNDVVIEQAEEGIDTIHSSVDYTLSANVENLTLIGVDSVNATGNALNNDVRGNEASNVLDGDAGDDSLQGFGGADTYLFGRGAGSDIVFDFSVAGEVDTIQLASDVPPADIEVYRHDFSLVLVITGTTDELILASFFDQAEYANKQVQFADGTIWNEAELRARAVDGGPLIGTTGDDTLVTGAAHRVLIGNAGNDILTGGDWDDVLYGDATFQSLSGPQVIGNDTLIGGAGDDTLIDFRGTNLFDGGAGNDSLALGTGVDTVLFGRGSGVDIVGLDNNRNDVDVIQLAAGISPADVVMTRRSSALSNIVDLRIPDSGDLVSVVLSTDFFAVGPETTQAMVRFADGTEWNLAGATPDLPFTETPPGPSGDNTYFVGVGSGPIVELPGEGIDTVQSTVDYTLSANVENLFLADNFSGGPYAERATGNGLDNLIIGNTRDNILDGGAGNDVLVGGLFRAFEVGLSETGSDILIGGAGDDVLMADGGNFAFYSISGFDGGGERRDDVVRQADDLFIGGVGNDTYILHSQQQTVAEFANEGTDTVEAYVSYALGENIENLTLVGVGSLSGTGTGLDNVLIGNNEGNVLDGREGNDTLWGGSARNIDSGVVTSGNDTLVGGSGNDTYLFKIGDEIDTIQDASVLGAGNRIQFGTGIAQADLTFTEDQAARTLTIRVGSSGTDQLLLTNFDPTGANGSLVVETLAFADGSTASLASLLGLGGPVATNGDDTIVTGSGDDVVGALGGNDIVDTGAGNDTITGGTGNDQLTGGAGNDTYLFNVGDGVDTIIDTAAPGEGNTLEFGTGITPTDLTLGLGSLLIRVGTNGDAIHLTPFDPNDSLGAHAIETFRFADGTTLSYGQLLTHGFDLTGTAGNDSIAGTNMMDRVTGLAGDDELIGGQGNDTLRGQAGDDTYVFNVGDGIDTIEDTVTVGEGNRIQFGVGIAQTDLTFTRDETSRTLTIQVGGSGTDQLLLTNFDPTNANGSFVVETLAYADGSTANLVDLFPPNHAPTVATPLTDQTVPEDAPLSLVVPSTTFADEDAGDGLTLSASLTDGSALPTWLTFDAATATFNGTPNDGQVGSLDVRVTATDTGTLSVSDTFTLTVANVNEAPTVAVPLADQQAVEDVPFSLFVPVGTFADVDAGDTLTYSATLDNGAVLPTWLSFDPVTRTLSGTPLNSDVGNLTIVVKATDSGSLNATDTFALAIQNVNDAPTVANPIVDQFAPTGATFAFTVPTNTFADVDLGDQLTYSVILEDGSALPAWLSFNGTTRAFNGTPSSGDVGLVSLTVTATDSGSFSVSDVFALTVTVQDQILTGTAGSDVLTGGAGNDQLFGLAGNDTLIGGLGHDLLDGGTGTDTMQGEAGSDTYVVDVAGDVVTELANEGTDMVQTSLLAYTLGANVENLTLIGAGPSAGIGNAAANQLIGNSGANLLDGKAGADTMAGGAGDDLYIVDNVGDTVVELASEGTLDSVTSSVSYTLSAHVENLVFTGSAAINGTGNDEDNILTGNSAANVLTGLAGNDTYIIGTGDTVVEAAGGGTDTVVSGITHTLTANVETLTLVGFSAINGTGNGLDNVLNGLLNLAGNILTGGAGNDTYIIGAGDTVVEVAGGGTDTVQSLFTYTLGSNVENLTLTGIGAINGTGNSLNNTITGNSANNVLSSAGGADMLRGGQGNDTVNGGGGNDIFQFGRGEGQDLVQDNGGTADKILYDAGINPLDLVISRQANDLRLTIHGSSDRITVQNWYTSSVNRTETIQAGNGQTLLSTQVDQLIQAMAQFSAANGGITWDLAIDQQPAAVQTILAANGWS